MQICLKANKDVKAYTKDMWNFKLLICRSIWIKMSVLEKLSILILINEKID